MKYDFTILFPFLCKVHRLATYFLVLFLIEEKVKTALNFVTLKIVTHVHLITEQVHQGMERGGVREVCL